MNLARLLELVRKRFPEISSLADADYARYRFPPEPGEVLAGYEWFERLAQVLNRRMVDGSCAPADAPLLQFLGDQLDACDGNARDCMDVGFMENLFWQVPADRARPYWDALSDEMRGFHVGFFGRAPI